MSKDLKNALDDIESTEKESARLQQKIDRLEAMVEKQKAIIEEQEEIIERKSNQSTPQETLPPDVIELKEIIGTQRASIKEKDETIQFLRGERAEIKNELDFLKKQSVKLEDKYDESFDKITQLKTELAEKKADVRMKDEKIRELELEVKELKTYQDRIESKFKKERDELQSQINEFETSLMDHKLMSTEKISEAKDFATRFKNVKERYDKLIQDIQDLRTQVREKDEKIEDLKAELQNLEGYKELTDDVKDLRNDMRKKEEVIEQLRDANQELKQNQAKISKKASEFDKLKNLMEEVSLFKAYLIIRDVGGKGVKLDLLKQSLGIPMVTVKKYVDRLKDVGLIKEDIEGRITIKK
ncbi:MAG: hypothetical protein EU541_03580 [Promethearchaeota archaeon]|nr:MAG: hypothetical protein EU541_03580 [Candidatus Lokiarchaeota archaeon]